MEYKNLKELAKIIYDINVEKGFWKGNRPFSEVVALVHSELSEAFEEYRSKEKLPNGGMHYFSEKASDGKVLLFEDNDCDKARKPEGIAVEMIDVLIRVLDWCGSESIDVDELISEKINFNKSRPHKHNKNC